MSARTTTAARESRRWLYLLIAAAILTQGGLNLIRPVTTYKLVALGADSFLVGAVTAFYALVPLATAVWLGRMSDRIPNLRPMVALGAVVLAAGTAALALGSSFVVIAIGSAVLGLGHLLFTIAGQAEIARRSTPAEMDRGFGWFTAAFSVGQMIGPLIAGAILGSELVSTSARLHDVNVALWVGFAMTLAAAPLFVSRRDSKTRHRLKTQESTTTQLGSRDSLTSGDTGESNETRDAASAQAPDNANAAPQAAPEKPTILRILRTRGVMSHMFASLALLGMLDILTAFLPLLGEEAGISPAAVGLLLALRGSASIVSRVLLPWLSAHFSRSTLLLWSLYGAGFSLAIPPLLLAAFPPAQGGELTLLLSGLFMLTGGIFLGMGQPLTMTEISTSVPASWRGSALAVRLMGNRLGQVALPLLAGVFAAPLGPGAAIVMTSVFLVISGIEKQRRT